MGFFFKGAWQVCCERSTDTGSHAGRCVDSNPNRLARGNISEDAREEQLARIHGLSAMDFACLTNRPTKHQDLQVFIAYTKRDIIQLTAPVESGLTKGIRPCAS